MKPITVYMAHLCCTCLLLLCFFLFSCKKFTEVDLPIGKVTSAAVFSSEASATSAVLGLYAQMMPTIPFYSCGGTSIYAGLSAGEFTITNPAATEELQFESAQLLQGNSVPHFNFWQRAYKIIFQANACIEGLEAAAGLTTEVRDRLLSEARLTRAFTCFYLVNLFGDVPLVTTIDYKQNASLPRAPANDVYALIIADLEFARARLAPVYPTAGRVRPNKWAATALLARVQLYRGNWQAAESLASEIINSNVYALPANLNNVFLATSTEAIWQLMPVESGFNTTEARSFVPTTAASTKPAYALTPHLLAAFEPGDKRLAAWVGVKQVAAQSYAYPFKYKVRNVGLPITEHYMLLRYAEVLLIRAEALAQQDKLPEARADLNTIRQRAGLSPVTASTRESLLLAIAKERQVELFAEWGHRWLDLKRTGRTTEVLSPLKPAWQPGAALWPVPLAEILQNPALVQNPGY